MAGEITLDTLGDLVAHGYRWTAHCNACGRGRMLGMDQLVARLGSDFPSIGRRPPLRCSSCGSRDVVVHLSAVPRGGEFQWPRPVRS